MSQIAGIYSPLVEGLIDFPPGEMCTFHQGIFIDGRQRERELLTLEENAPSTELQLLMRSERGRNRELSQQGLRKETFIRIYCTYTIGKAEEKSSDGIEKLLKGLEKTMGKMLGEKEQQENQALHTNLLDAYYLGYERWFNFLTSLGLEVKPYSAETLHERIVERFTEQKIAPAQIIYVTPDGLELTKNSELNPISRIFLESPVPVAHEKYIENKGKCVGIYSLQEKADTWKDARAQMQAIWKVLSKPDVRDTEIFTQIYRADMAIYRENMRRLASQAKNEKEETDELGKVNLGVKQKIDKAMKAGESLYDGSIPFKTAVIMAVHRDSPKELDRAHEFLRNEFRTPLVLAKENVYPFDLWCQTFPICWEKLLSEYGRTNSYNNKEILGIVPLVKPYSGDRQGLEFLTIEGGIPVYLDLWKVQKHLMIMATTRAGKGVLVARLINNDLVRGIPVAIIDYPKEDGTGTFSDYADLLGEIATYFNPAREKLNIMGLPDLSAFENDRQKQNERMADFKSGVCEILEVMVCGCNPRPEVDVTTVQSLLTQAVSYFYSPEENQKVYRRFCKALEGGIGSQAWNNTPTLHDFIDILGFERLGISEPSPEQFKTMKFIIMRLNFWLSTEMGQALSAPSTIDSQALLTVYALTKMEDEDKASVIMMAIKHEAERKSMQYPESSLYIDEISKLVKLKAIAKMTARECATALKSGRRLTIIGQEIESIVAQTEYKAAILDNIACRLTGLIAPSATDAFESVLKYERELIRTNATKRFLPSRQHLATKWLLENSNEFNQVAYYADGITLAAAVNNQKEVERRAQLLAEHIRKYAAEHPEQSSEEHERTGKLFGIAAYAEELKVKLAGS